LHERSASLVLYESLSFLRMISRPGLRALPPLLYWLIPITEARSQYGLRALHLPQALAAVPLVSLFTFRGGYFYFTLALRHPRFPSFVVGDMFLFCPGSHKWSTSFPGLPQPPLSRFCRVTSHLRLTPLLYSQIFMRGFFSFGFPRDPRAASPAESFLVVSVAFSSFFEGYLR